MHYISSRSSLSYYIPNRPICCSPCYFLQWSTHRCSQFLDSLPMYSANRSCCTAINFTCRVVDCTTTVAFSFMPRTAFFQISSFFLPIETFNSSGFQTLTNWKFCPQYVLLLISGCFQTYPCRFFVDVHPRHLLCKPLHNSYSPHIYCYNR